MKKRYRKLLAVNINIHVAVNHNKVYKSAGQAHITNIPCIQQFKTPSTAMQI